MSSPSLKEATESLAEILSLLNPEQRFQAFTLGHSIVRQVLAADETKVGLAALTIAHLRLQQGMAIASEQLKTRYYFLAPDNKSITCLLCGNTSHNPHDVAHRYCGACHAFHEGP